MKSIVSFLGGIIFTLVVLAGFGYFAVKTGIVPANADSKPAALESWDEILVMRPKNYSRPLPNRVSGLNFSMLIGRLRAQMSWQGSLHQSLAASVSRPGCRTLEEESRLGSPLISWRDYHAVALD